MAINKQTIKGRVIMNKIYGFKESRIKDFGEYLKRTENTKSLTKIFAAVLRPSAKKNCFETQS